MKGDARMFEKYEDILTTEETCEALRIGKNRLYQLLGSGELKGYKEGRHWKISKEEMINYVRNHIRRAV